MPDAVTHSSSPVMDASRHDDVEKAASSDSTLKGVVMTWQLKALLAGRTPLPSSRPKRKSDEMESPESSDHPDSSTLDDSPSAKCVDGSHNKDDKETTTVSHVAKKSKMNSPKTARKQWSEHEIRRVIVLRRKQIPWEQILEHFPTRTLVGIRQIFWKYNAGYTFPWKKL
ncbi:hypothetical protein TGAM01_v203462 [Trichoderma gamsii]|uniref:Myb-like domain-containing protein n=1 Tax=Trichoderma gamsii TaxID=398673 RepID=A0A2P4ZTS6_9HYPO|nr:hypothetical protein TGAM01_v203462 [Trichoderma gamsii]PON27695.1 hypothetical protein TGAM01_v203462 [Trichoderma gamsii]